MTSHESDVGIWALDFGIFLDTTTGQGPADPVDQSDFISDAKQGLYL